MGSGRIALAFVVAVSALGATWFARGDRSAPGGGPPNRPFALRTTNLPLIEVDEPWLAALERRLMPGPQSAFPKTASGLLHALRLFGLDAEFSSPELPNGRSMVLALTDNRASDAVFGAPVLRRTKTGARYAEMELLPALRTGNQESHLDQTLAVFGEIGLPLSTEIRAGGEPMRLADVLTDLIAHYDGAAQEFEWTAMAICLYVPPAASWVDRFGERSDFDDLAGRLLAADPARSPCAGAHLVQLLIVLDQVDERHRVLSGAVRRAVRSRLREMVEAVVRTQCDDGGFDPHWWTIAAGQGGSHPDAHSLADDLLATGHLVECFLRLPEDLRPDASVLGRAGEHVVDVLTRVAEDVEFLRRNYCPVAHAIRAIRHMKREHALPCVPDGPERDSANVSDKG